MKKLLALGLALGLTLAFTACGGTDKGGDADGLTVYEAGSVSIALPSDMQPVEASAGYTFQGEGTAVTVSDVQDVAESAADITEDFFYSNAENNGMSNVTVSGFANDVTVGSGTAAIATISGETSSGKTVTIVMLYCFPAENQMLVINLLYGTGAGTALEQNIEAVIDSITLN